MQTVDLVIPVYNEEASLPALFDALEPLLADGVIRRVIIGDNGSTDGSAALAESRGAIVAHETRRGYGAACLAALSRIRGSAADGHTLPTAVAFLDADLSDDPTQLPAMIDLLDAHDLVLGNRLELAEEGALTSTQRFGSRVASMMIRWMTRHRYQDLGPMRVIRWDALDRLGMQDRTWGWTVEMQAKAALAGLRTFETDVPYRVRRAGRSKISGRVLGSIRAGWRIMWTVVAVRWTWQDANKSEPTSQ